MIFRKIDKVDLSFQAIEKIVYFLNKRLVLNLVFVKKFFFYDNRHIENKYIALILALALAVVQQNGNSQNSSIRFIRPK